MFEVPGGDGKDEAALKEIVKNYTLGAYERNSDGSNGKEILVFNGSDMSFAHIYDNNGAETTSNYATMKFSTGPDAGKVNFVLKDGDKEIGKNENVDFHATKPMNILAVPVTSFYSKSDPSQFKGACPTDKLNTAVPCDETKWNGIDKTLATYLLDVFPTAEINVTLGKTIDAGSAEYDMATSDGQKKLWEVCNKLMTKDKETGKNKYDIILAFVQYRQDMGGGQGYTYGKPTNIITLSDADMLPTVAHEIAHCYQVGDEYDGGSFNVNVNPAPNGYKGRNYVTGEDMTVSGVSSYWKAPKESGIANVNENGAGTIVFPSLHGYQLSADKYITYAKESGGQTSPTISYMGSNYSGDDGYYWTSAPVWRHLFKEFLVKEKKTESSETPSQEPEQESEQQSVNRNDEADSLEVSALEVEANEDDKKEDTSSTDDKFFDDDDLYYGSDYREGKSKIIEVSGYVDKGVDENGKIDNNLPYTVDMNPMFSYEGDLSYLEDPMNEIDDKLLEQYAQSGNIYTFAAVDNSLNIIKSPVDKELSYQNFVVSMYNGATSEFQDFDSFDFEAEFPTGTAKFIIFKGYPDENGTYDQNGIIWTKEVPAKAPTAKVTSANFDTTENTATVTWQSNKTTDANLYTEIYYAVPKDVKEGEEADEEVYYITNSEEEDYTEGSISIDISNTESGYGYKDGAYIWISVTDGVNSVDIYSDDYTSSAPAVSVNPKTVTLNKAKNAGESVTLVNTTGSVSDLKLVDSNGNAVTAFNVTYNAGKVDITIADDSAVSGKYSLSFKMAGSSDVKTVPITITVNEKKPKITVKQSSPVYTFRTQGNAVVFNISSDAGTISAVTVEDTSKYTLNYTYKQSSSVIQANVTVKNGIVIKKGDTIKFIVKYDDYKDQECTFKLTTVDKKPVIKADTKATIYTAFTDASYKSKVTITDPFYFDDSVVVTYGEIQKDKTFKANEDVVVSTENLIYDGTIKITYKGSKPEKKTVIKGCLRFSSNLYVEPIYVTNNITIDPTEPKLQLSAKKATLNITSKDTAKFDKAEAYVWSIVGNNKDVQADENVYVKSVSITPVTEAGAKIFNYSSNDSTRRVEVSLKELSDEEFSALKTGSYKFSIKATLANDKEVTLPFEVKLINKKPYENCVTVKTKGTVECTYLFNYYTVTASVKDINANVNNIAIESFIESETKDDHKDDVYFYKAYDGSYVITPNNTGNLDLKKTYDLKLAVEVSNISGEKITVYKEIKKVKVTMKPFKFSAAQLKVSTTKAENNAVCQSQPYVTNGKYGIGVSIEKVELVSSKTTDLFNYSYDYTGMCPVITISAKDPDTLKAGTYKFTFIYTMKGLPKNGSTAKTTYTVVIK